MAKSAADMFLGSELVGFIFSLVLNWLECTDSVEVNGVNNG
jgi:hypothetical protein